MDVLLAESRLPELEQVLSGFHARLCNEAATDNQDRNEIWRTAFAFARDTVTRLASNTLQEAELRRFHAAMLRLRTLYEQLRISRAGKPETLRSLPPLVIAELDRIVDPSSPRNPFRNSALAWRNWAIHLLLLHKGLTEGEVLVLPVDALKHGRNPHDGRLHSWLDVNFNENESDPRSDPPSIKNAYRVRQLPVAPALRDVVQAYIDNYRGRQPHSFLFSSQQDKPLSKAALADIFRKLSSHMSSEAKRELLDRRKKRSVTPHDLRHSSACVHLAHYIDSGDPMEIAVEKLRAVFGWSRTSDMPRHYARGLFEARQMTHWQEQFDSYERLVTSLEL